MLERIGNERAASSADGYTVRLLGSPMTQFYIEYEDGGRLLRYRLENLAPGTPQPIVPGEIGPWLPPHASTPISAALKLLIAERSLATPVLSLPPDDLLEGSCDRQCWRLRAGTDELARIRACMSGAEASDA